jgi:hypothetical protein
MLQWAGKRLSDGYRCRFFYKTIIHRQDISFLWIIPMDTRWIVATGNHRVTGYLVTAQWLLQGTVAAVPSELQMLQHAHAQQPNRCTAAVHARCSAAM